MDFADFGSGHVLSTAKVAEIVTAAEGPAEIAQILPEVLVEEFRPGSVVATAEVAEILSAAEAAAEIAQIGPEEVLENAEMSEWAELRRPW